MIPSKTSKYSFAIGCFALLAAMFITAEASAQSQYCECYDSVNVVRRAPVRRVANRHRVRRARNTARVRTVYRTVYVPTARAASYVAYADKNNCDVNYVPASRVVVTEPVSATAYYGSAYNTDAIARGWGHRDGFKDGWKAALKYRTYNPENNHDYRDADNGYKRRFGSKFLYRTSYRRGYVSGYDSGFRSVAGNSEIRF